MAIRAPGGANKGLYKHVKHAQVGICSNWWWYTDTFSAYNIFQDSEQRRHRQYSFKKWIWDRSLLNMKNMSICILCASPFGPFYGKQFQRFSVEGWKKIRWVVFDGFHKAISNQSFQMADCKSRTWGKWWSSGGSVHLLRSFAISSAKCGWWGEDSIYLLNSTTRGGGGCHHHHHHHHQHWHYHVERSTPPPKEGAVVIIIINIDIIIATDQLHHQRWGRSSSSSEAAWSSNWHHHREGSIIPPEKG